MKSNRCRCDSHRLQDSLNMLMYCILQLRWKTAHDQKADTKMNPLRWIWFRQTSPKDTRTFSSHSLPNYNTWGGRITLFMCCKGVPPILAVVLFQLLTLFFANIILFLIVYQTTRTLALPVNGFMGNLTTDFKHGQKDADNCVLLNQMSTGMATLGPLTMENVEQSLPQNTVWSC